MTELEQILSQMVEGAELESKNVIGEGYHGSSRGDAIPYTVWYDPFYREWTTKEMALRGYIFLKLVPIIRKCIKENE